MGVIKFQCPACGQRCEAPEEGGGCAIECPSCGHPFCIPSAPSPETPATEAAQPAPVAGLCAICQSPIQAGEPKAACSACRAEYHADCWQENRGCAVYGCAQVPWVEQRGALEIPVSYWGTENKPCPACGCQILAAAVRCRHCGATFSSARPEDTEEFRARAAREARLPGIKRTVLWLFVLSILPCSAPVGAVSCAAWYPFHREDIRALPSIYAALGKIALAAGIGQTVMIVVMALLYAAVRGS